MTFAKRLKSLMIKRYGSDNKSKLGKELGIKESTVRNWLNKSIPRPAMMQELCRLFLVSPEWLLYGNEADKDKIILQDKEKALIEYAQKTGFDKALEILKLITEEHKSGGLQTPGQHLNIQAKKRIKKTG